VSGELLASAFPPGADSTSFSKTSGKGSTQYLWAGFIITKSSPFAGFSDVVRGTIHLYYELFTDDYETYETKQIYKSISQITTKRASVMTSKVFGKPSKKRMNNGVTTNIWQHPSQSSHHLLI
jgi:hypothetical protein